MLPLPLSELGIANPYPQLPEVWNATSADWGRHVPAADSIESAVVLGIALKIQSRTGGSLPDSPEGDAEIPE